MERNKAKSRYTEVEVNRLLALSIRKADRLLLLAKSTVFTEGHPILDLSKSVL